jgi:hypothetical protein
MSDKRTKYSEETKRKAVEDFNAGKKSAQNFLMNWVTKIPLEFLTGRPDMLRHLRGD